jgi:hypothetical protein
MRGIAKNLLRDARIVGNKHIDRARHDVPRVSAASADGFNASNDSRFAAVQNRFPYVQQRVMKSIKNCYFRPALAS